jgi:23S rRNA (cytidine2498-2'-O)-methyltransferase
MNFSVFNKNNMIDTKSMLFYCREGYEADLAAELEIVSADQKLYGYSQFLRNSAMVQFHFYQALSLPVLHSMNLFLLGNVCVLLAVLN